MKVIDLLNRIANGKEVPKKIKYEGRDMFYCEPCKIYELEEVEKGELCGTDLYNILDNLNDEVEIIEEDKKIKRLKNLFIIPDRTNENLIILVDKINEIIDKINKD